jgi:5-methylcytosine-specific restriction endonuclease McrA
MKPNGERDYSYDTHYEASSAQRKNRSERVMARRELSSEGRVSKGDGKDVDHIRSLSNGGSNDRSNLRVTSAHSNRSRKNNDK